MLPSPSVRQSQSLFKSMSPTLSIPILTKIARLKELNEQLAKREANIENHAKYFAQHPDVLMEYLIATHALLKDTESLFKSISIEDSIEEPRTELAHQEALLKEFADRARSMEYDLVHAQDIRRLKLPPQKSRGLVKFTAALESIPEDRVSRTYTV